MHEQGEQPRRSKSELGARAGIFAIVVLASAGIGFMASRQWPLPSAYTHFWKVESRSTLQREPARVALPAANPLDIPSTPRLTSGADAPAAEATAASTPFTIINPGSTQPPPVGEQPIETGSAGSQRENVGDGPNTPVSEEKARRPRVPAKGETVTAAPKAAPAASGYQHDRAMREFMSTDLHSSR